MSGLIIPFCVYYQIDEKTATYWSRITVSQLIEKEDKTVTFECPPYLFLEKDRWFLGAVFYGVSPIIKPIPREMVPVGAHYRESFPYDTTRVDVVWNPFKISPKSLVFITYPRPVENTIPIYFWKRYNNVFVTFSKDPPGKGIKWEQETISPVWVMWNFYTDFKTGKMVKNYRLSVDRMNEALKQGIKIKRSELLDHYTKFSCIGNACVPDPKGKNMFLDCMLPCLEKNIQELEYTDEPQAERMLIEYNTLSQNEMKKKRSPFIKTFKNTNETNIIVVIVVFGVSILTFLYLIYLKNHYELRLKEY